MDGTSPVIRAKIKVTGKNFCFNEIGQMQDGLQMIGGSLYYFDNDGYMKTGKIANVEEENDTFTYYFETKNAKNGQGVTGEKSGYLYWNGKRLEADDDYKLYKVGTEYYLVNNKGKLQKSESKEFELENMNGETYKFKINKNSYRVTEAYKMGDNGKVESTVKPEELKAEVPVIELYDSVITEDNAGKQVTMLADELDKFVEDGRVVKGETNKAE